MAKHAPTVSRFDEKQFLVIGLDGPGSAAKRDTHLEGHLDYVERRCDRYLLCGPMLDAEDGTLYGSFFVVLAESAAEARALVGADPYVSNGVYERIDVHSVTAAAGKLMGGVIWESAEAIRARQAGS